MDGTSQEQQGRSSMENETNGVNKNKRVCYSCKICECALCPGE